MINNTLFWFFFVIKIYRFRSIHLYICSTIIHYLFKIERKTKTCSFFKTFNFNFSLFDLNTYQNVIEFFLYIMSFLATSWNLIILSVIFILNEFIFVKKLKLANLGVNNTVFFRFWKIFFRWFIIVLMCLPLNYNNFQLHT